MYQHVAFMAYMYDSFTREGLSENQFYPAFIEASKELNSDVIIDIITIKT